MEDKTIGFAVCGSFCTHARAMEALEQVKARFARVIPIVSECTAATDPRFGCAHGLMREMSLCDHRVISTIRRAGAHRAPEALLDLLIIAPVQTLIPWVNWPPASPTPASPWRPKASICATALPHPPSPLHQATGWPLRPSWACSTAGTSYFKSLRPGRPGEAHLPWCPTSPRYPQYAQSRPGGGSCQPALRRLLNRKNLRAAGTPAARRLAFIQ